MRSKHFHPIRVSIWLVYKYRRKRMSAQNYLQMKKSLAIKLEQSGEKPNKKKLLTRKGQSSTGSKSMKSGLNLQISTQTKAENEIELSTKIESAYRNKNLSTLPASLLNTISSLTTLDISENKLTDSQIELLMNSCPKLQILCIEDNLSRLIPGSIWKLKNLEQFRHDWIKLFPDQTYQSEENLKNIKVLAKKSHMLTKSHGIVGLSFSMYCSEIAKMELNEMVQEKIHASNCSDFAKKEMLESIRAALNFQKDEENTDIEGVESSRKDFDVLSGSVSSYGFEPEFQQKHRKFEGTLGKDTRGIRSLRETQITSTHSSITHSQIPDMVYQHKDMPLHLLFSKYDKNYRGSIDIDRLLIKGYNPNTYDQNGLSPYHIVIIFRQELALERLMEISFKNPGFFDLQMPSMKEGRNILHFSVFLKDYAFTKRLIEFGLPIDKRDYKGARLVHLVDQNYQFLLLLRKALKKKYESMRTPTFFTYPEPMAKKYSRHPPRVTQESNYQTFENKNLNLLQMYEAATGTRSNRT